MGVATSVVATSGGTTLPPCVDSVAPELTSFSCSPSSVDVTTADARATCSFNVHEDDVDDFSALSFTYRKPSGANHSVNVEVHGSGVARSFAWDFPRGSESGVWQIIEVNVSDASGNTRTYIQEFLPFLAPFMR